MASRKMAIILLTANCLLMVEKAISKKGMFMATNKIDKGILVSSLIISEIPVTPPSIKALGRRKPFRPKQADSMPIRMKILSLIKCVYSTLALISILSNSLEDVV